MCGHAYAENKKLTELNIFIVPLLTEPDFGIMLYSFCHGSERHQVELTPFSLLSS